MSRGRTPSGSLVGAFRQLRVDRESAVPLQTQLAQQLIWLVASGQIGQADRLPSVRALANHLGIAVQTVQAAYRQLEAAGIVETRHGSGTVVRSKETGNLAAGIPDLVSGTFGVLLPTFSPFYAPFLRGLQEEAKLDSALLFICQTEEFASGTVTYLDQLVAKGVDGLIVASFGQAEAAAWREALTSTDGLPPTVFADSPGAPGPGVFFDLEAGAADAAGHILAHGHRRIGALLPPEGWTNVAPIVRGYRRAIEEAPAAGQELVLASGPDFSPESGAVLARTLFAQNDPPTALLVASDTLAIGVLRALQEMGLKVPQDVGIVGFGDLEIAPLLDPPLTTVSLPADEMGRQVMAMLRRLRGGARLRPRHSTIGTRLVIRRSCGCREDSV